jgi:hypothetical protein
MHLEVIVGAVAEDLRAARPKIGEPGDELLRVEVVVRLKCRVAMVCSLVGRGLFLTATIALRAIRRARARPWSAGPGAR